MNEVFRSFDFFFVLFFATVDHFGMHFFTFVLLFIKINNKVEQYFYKI